MASREGMRLPPVKRRRRFFREVHVRLDCGHVTEINTSRFRVSKDLAAIIVLGRARRGCWCLKCGAMMMPTEFLGVFRGEEAKRPGVDSST